MKGRTQWGLIFLIAEGYPTKKLIAMGFSKATIYAYRHKWNKYINPEIKKLKGIE